MKASCSMFSQILKLIPRIEFERIVRETRAEYRSKGLSSWSQFVGMLFCQLGRAHSLREIEGGLKSCEGKLAHLGIEAPARSSLSYANSHRPWQLSEKVFYGLFEKVAAKVLALFADGAFDVATLFFSRFKSVISQIPTAQQIIPATIPAEAPSQEVALGGAVYEYEPDEAEILTELLPLNITVQIFKALLENAASEQGARMSAMDNATRNAGDMIGRLTLRYNRTRQAMITKELIEIISGAEAL